MPTIQLPNHWRPRDYQIPAWRYLEGGGKRAALVCHRRWGKDDIALNWAAVSAHQRVGSYWHMLPQFAQGRKAIWNAVNAHTGKRRIDEAFPLELRENTIDDDMLIRLKSGSTWQVVGSDSYNTLVGAGVAGITFSEWSLSNPAAWGFLSPMLAENDGWALFVYTARGRNHGWSIYQRAMEDEGWFGLRQSAEDTNVFSAESLEEARKDYTALYGEDDGTALWRQEYYCDFDAAILGAFYGREIRRAEEENRIINIPVERSKQVFTAWDLGFTDSTAIWFGQQVGREIHWIDYYEANNQGLDHYAKVLRDRDYVYSAHYLPHDVQAHELGSGKSRVATLQSLGIQPTVVPLSQVMDGINAVRLMFDRFWFDVKKCERGLDALRNYRREFDDKKKLYKPGPLHDWTCFAPDTEVLTRNGSWPISNLPETGEILTPCGWRQYTNPRVTGRNAPLVEVLFAGGYTVRCTPEHMFLTESGWKSAEHLTQNTVIQSTLTKSRSISMAVSTGFGRARRIFREAARKSIVMCGQRRLGLFRRIVTSITKMGTSSTTSLATSNASPPPSTWRPLGLSALSLRMDGSAPQRGTSLPSGTVHRKGGFGISATPSGQSRGSSGSESRKTAQRVARVLMRWFVPMAIRRSIARLDARALRVAGVRTLPDKSEVWCLTVPDGAWFSLANGAVVHNSHGADAMRTFATGYPDRPVRLPIDKYRRDRKSSGGSAWAA